MGSKSCDLEIDSMMIQLFFEDLLNCIRLHENKLLFDPHMIFHNFLYL